MQKWAGVRADSTTVGAAADAASVRAAGRRSETPRAAVAATLSAQAPRSSAIRKNRRRGESTDSYVLRACAFVVVGLWCGQ